RSFSFLCRNPLANIAFREPSLCGTNVIVGEFVSALAPRNGHVRSPLSKMEASSSTCFDGTTGSKRPGTKPYGWGDNARRGCLLAFLSACPRATRFVPETLRCWTVAELDNVPRVLTGFFVPLTAST